MPRSRRAGIARPFAGVGARVPEAARLGRLDGSVRCVAMKQAPLAPRCSPRAEVTYDPRHAEDEGEGHHALEDQGPAVAHADESQDSCGDGASQHDAGERRQFSGRRSAR
jgi:hypothetical protein